MNHRHPRPAGSQRVGKGAHVKRCEHGFLPPKCLVCHQHVGGAELAALGVKRKVLGSTTGVVTERLVDGKKARVCVLCPDHASRGGYFCNHHRRLLNDTKRREDTRAYRRGPYKCAICGRHGHTAKTHQRFGFDGQPPERRCQDCNEPMPVAATTARCQTCLEGRRRRAAKRKRGARRAHLQNGVI